MLDDICDDTECHKPLALEGDLHLLPEALAYVAWRRKPKLRDLGLLFFTLPTFVMRGHRMCNWRDAQRGKSIQKKVEENPDSWLLRVEDIATMKNKFPATLIIATKAQQEYRLTVSRWPSFKRFALKHNWPLQ